jgi:hypothetical protein
MRGWSLPVIIQRIGAVDIPKASLYRGFSAALRAKYLVRLEIP